MLKNLKGSEKQIAWSEKMFLKFAEGLTGTKKENIRVIWFEENQDGLFHGSIEIDGNREYIHEYV